MERRSLNERLRDGIDRGKPNIPEASHKPAVDVRPHDGKSVKVEITGLPNPRGPSPFYHLACLCVSRHHELESIGRVNPKREVIRG